MSRFEARLARLEAARPLVPPVESQPIGRMALKLDEIIEGGKRFNRLSAREQVAELRADLRAHQARLREPEGRTRSAVPGLSEKLIKLDFTDVITEQLHTAELRYLRERGYQDAAHPLTPDLRELLDIEFFAE